MSFLGDQSLIWLNGKLIKDQEACISIMSHTLHYGSGVFEGVRAYQLDQQPAIFRLEDHTKRLFNSAKMLGIEIPYSQDDLNNAQKEVVRINDLSTAYIRPIVFYSADTIGVSPANNKIHVAIAAWQWSNYFKNENEGLNVMTSTFKRQNVSSVLTKAKVNGYYVNSMLALQEAKRKNYHEAILFDINGFIAECSSANIFLVKSGIIYTPTEDNILPGITRDTIIKLANDANLKVIEKNLTRDELYLADEIFFTGTAAEVTAVSTVDDMPTNDGPLGKVTMQMKEAYEKAVSGKNTQYPEWNTLV